MGLKSSAAASVNSDGTVSLVEGSTDIGGTRTSIAMQLAEALGIRAEDVKPQVVDTDSIGDTDVTGGSRTTFATGWAAYQCALDIKEQLIERAAKLWEISTDDVAFDDGTFFLHLILLRPSRSKSWLECLTKQVVPLWAGQPSIRPAWVAPLR